MVEGTVVLKCGSEPREWYVRVLAEVLLDRDICLPSLGKSGWRNDEVAVAIRLPFVRPQVPLDAQVPDLVIFPIDENTPAARFPTVIQVFVIDHRSSGPGKRLASLA